MILIQHRLYHPPGDADLNVLSLGGGVQSSAIALMASKGLFRPMPDFAVFADTQAEPSYVYDWLDWLEGELQFDVIRVTQGNLTEESLRVRYSKNTGKSYMKNNIPVYFDLGNGKSGMAARQCTANFKITPIYRYVRSKLTKGGRANIWIGISWDEIQRMKEPNKSWVSNRYPLVEMKITRSMCKSWMVDNGYPEPPRSACVYCPFHNNREWKRLKYEMPEEFDLAVEYEKELQDSYSKIDRIDGVPYLHNSLIQLDKVDFDGAFGQGDLFGNECEGYCGL